MSAALEAETGERAAVPADVMTALDRMCTPLHSSRLTGVTAECDARDMKVIRDHINDIHRLLAAAPPPAVPQWLPIESAPEGSLVVVGWLDAEDEDHPERHDFDMLEDGVWQAHENNVQHAECCAPPGSRMPKQTAPYTHWMPVPVIPGAPACE